MRSQARTYCLLFILLQRVVNAAEFPQLVRQFRQQIGVLRENFLVRDNQPLGTLLRNVEHDAANLRRAARSDGKLCEEVVDIARHYPSSRDTQWLKYNDDCPITVRTFWRAR